MLSNASKIICFHNHPSGNLKCSKEDENITDRLKEWWRNTGNRISRPHNSRR